MRIEKIRDVKTPTRGTIGSAGIDFYVPNEFSSIYLEPFKDINIPSGIKADIPHGFVLLAFNKSGVSLKKRLQVGASVVDSDYTGEIHLHIYNTTDKTVVIDPGEKLVQFILIPYSPETIEVVQEINKQTSRGDGGFGSTGNS